MAMMATTKEPSQCEARDWWRDAVVYQIYPASFFDSNGDGLGDINGIAMKLDHIKNLGADTIWLSPVFKSPQVDMGYDISDYRDIYEKYGTMVDMERLIAAVHDKNMKIVMDLVVNHTSDQHVWFQQSRSSKNNPYRNWYVWRPGRVIDGIRHPPNNWRGMFGGSTWEFDPLTSEYYLHCFAVEQPDLNWENPSVIQAVHDIMHFWLQKGVNGFRCDVINFISKAPDYPDAPITNPHMLFQDASALFANGPKLHQYLRGIGKLLESYDAFSVGEMPFAKDENEVIRVVSSKSKELNMIFQFDIVEIDIGTAGKFTHNAWELRVMKRIIRKSQNLMHENSGWNAIFAENHDQARTISRFASDLPEHRVYAAKLLATWLGCLGGTLFIYQGQELGMRNVPEEWPIDEYKDIETQNHWAELLSKSPTPETLQQNRAQIQLKARDNARTPVQWTNAPNGGFTTATAPWMRANSDYTICNAAAQIHNQESVYNYWASIIALRREYKDVIVYGSFQLIDEENPAVFAYERKFQRKRVLVALNWSSRSLDWEVPQNATGAFEHGHLLRSNYSRAQVRLMNGVMNLSPWEAVVVLEENSLL